MADTKPDCIFCKIVSGELPADKIYEDDHVVAFMDIRPVTRGHVLVVPKVHSDDFLSTSDEVLESMIPIVKKLANGVMRAMVAEGINISTNHGAAAGQSVFHLHFHLVPRFAKDGLDPWPHQEVEPTTRAQIAEFIKKNIA